MANQKLVRSPIKLIESDNEGTMPITEKTVMDYRNNFMTARTWRGAGMLAGYRGSSAYDYNGNFNSNFYIIQNYPAVPDAAYTDYTDRLLSGYVRFWNYAPSSPPDTITGTWYPDKDSGTSSTVFSYVHNGSNQTDAEIPTGGDQSLGILTTPFDEVSNFNWNVGRLNISNGIVASLGMWSLPWKTVDNNMAFGMDESIFRSGQILRGYDWYTPLGPAGVMQRWDNFQAGTGNSDTQDSAITSTKRCLFQTCWPTGVYDESTAGTYIPLRSDTASFASKIYVKPRNYKGSTANINTMPAVVVSNTFYTGLSCFIQYRSIIAGDTWTLELNSSNTTALYKNTSGSKNYLEVDPDGDEIEVWIHSGVGATASNMTVHSIALFENYQD